MALPARQPAQATAGINSTINFQGRLLNAAGAVVADGNYNMRFKIYQDGAGTAANNGGTGLKWVELHENTSTAGIVVKNGYFAVTLGSLCAFTGGSCQGSTNTAIDWNQDTLWLSMDVAGTGTGAGPTYDGELLPMRRLSSSVYALNAGLLGGLSSSQFIQNVSPAATQQTANLNILSGAATTVAAAKIQAVASATAPVLILKGGATPGSGADLLQLQSSSATLARVTSAGNLEVASSVDAYSAVPLVLGNTNATAITLNKNTTITGTSSGDLVVKSHTNGGGNLVFDGQRNNGTSLVRLTDDGEIALGSSSSSLPGRISVADSSGNYGIFQTVSNLGATRNYTLPANTGTVCLDANNCSAIMQLQDAYDNGTSASTTPEIKLTTSGGLNGVDIQDADSTMGTGQNFLSLRAASVGALGAIVTGFGIGGNFYVQPTANSTTLVDINTFGGGNLLTVDSTNQRVGINLGSTNLPTYTLDVTGTANASTSLLTPLLDTASGVALNVGTNNATAINLNQNTTVAAGKTLTVTSAASTFTGATSGDAVTVSNSTSSGNIAVFKDNSTTVATIADGGATSFQNSTDSTSAFKVQNVAGASLINVDTTNNKLVVGSGTNVELSSTGYLNTPYGGLGKYGNLLTRSEQFDHANWVKTNVTVTSDDGGSNPDPDTLNNADKLVSSSTSATVQQTYTTSTNGDYTFSVWLKTNSGTQPVDLRIDSTGATPTTGTASSVTATTSWQRFSVTQNFTGTPSNIKPTIVITNNSATVVAWGGQMVTGTSAQVYTRTVANSVASTVGLVADGTALFQNAVDSTTAFQIQNTGNANVFSVDTTNNLTRLSATGNPVALSASAGALAIGLDASANLIFDDNDIQARSNSTTATTLFVQRLGGSLTLGSTISTATSTVQGGVNGTTPTVSLQAATSGYIAIGTDNANTIQIGAVGSTANVSTINIANTSGNAQQIVSIGSAGATSSTLTLEGGTGASAIQIGNGATAHGIKIGTGAADNDVIIGSTTSGSTLTLQSASTISLGAGTLQRSAAGTTTVDLLDSGADTTLSVTNSDATRKANVSVEGSLTLGTALTVANGGTGLTSATAYGLLFGGTTSTSAFQSLGLGNSGEVLQSNGAGQLPSWSGGAGCSTCIAKVPTTPTQNTVTPTVNSVIGLTVNATSGTAAQALIVNQAAAYAGATVEVNHTNTSGTIDNAVLVNRNGTGGTTTNGINVTNTLGTLTNGINIIQAAGTLTNGLAFTGTIATDINRAVGTLTVSGAGGITLASAGNIINKSTTNSTTAYQIQNASSTALLTGDTTNMNIAIAGRLNVTKSSATTTQWSKVSQTTAGTISSGGTSAIDSVVSSAVYNGNVYVGTTKSGSAEIYRYDGGTTWTKVSQSTAGTIAASGTASIDGVYTLTVNNGIMYAGTGKSNAAEVYRYDGGTTWTKVSQSTAGTIAASGTASIDRVSTAVSFNGSLYVGTREGTSAEFYRFDGGTTWTKVSQSTAGTIAASGTASIVGVTSATVVNGSALYIGTEKSNAGEIYRYEGGSSWTKVSQTTAGTVAASGTANIDIIASLTALNGSVYAGTQEADSAEIYRYDGGSTWSKVSQSTAGTIASGGSASIDGISSMTVYHNALYASTYTTNDVGEIYRFDGSTTWTKISQSTAGTVASGGTASINEINELIVHAGSIYAGTVESGAAEVYRYSDTLFSVNTSDAAGVVNVGNTGTVVFQNSTDNTTAFQIQNASGTSVFTADTTNSKITVDSDLILAKRPDSGGTSSDFASVSNSTAGTISATGPVIPCNQAGIDTVKSSVVFNGSLYIGTSESNAAEVCRYDGGTSWTRINSNNTAGTFGAQTLRDTVSSMVVFNGQMYVGITESNAAAVYRWDGGTTFTLINTTVGQFNATGSKDGVSAMVVHQGQLYIGVTEPGGAKVYRYQGGTGTSVFIDLGATEGTFGNPNVAAMNTVSAMVSYQGVLYIGVNKDNAAQVFRYMGADGVPELWGSVGSTTGGEFEDEGSPIEDEVTGFAVYNGELYVATSDTVTTTSGARLFKLTFDTTYDNLYNSWNRINTAGTFGSQTGVDYIKSMAVYGGNLYIGTQEPFVTTTAGAGVYRYDISTQLFTLTNVNPNKFVTTSSIDGVTTMIPFNDKLFIGTSKSNGAEVYSFSMVEGQSRSLMFNAVSDNNGGGVEQSSYLNLASIYFAAEQSSTSNIQGAAGSFIFSHGINTNSGAYDVAEDYPTRDDTLKPGDLVSIDPHETGFVRKATGPYDTGLVGVYSEKPALRLSQKDVTINGGRAIPVALAGRVPVKVTGDVAPGDPLTSSSIPGVAMKATGSGRIVGMAMGPHSGADVGSVMSFVNPNYYSGNTDLQSSGAMGDAVVTGTLTTKDLVVTNKATIKTLMVTGEATVGSLTVTGTATTKSLVATDSVTTKDLAVSGSADLTDVTVSGHITTKGDKPTVSAESGAGKDAQVSVDGNDVSGTITVKAGKEGVAGNLVKVTFAKPYDKAPHVVISPNGSKAAELQEFLGGYSITEFIVGANVVLVEGQEYKFEYFVTQGE